MIKRTIEISRDATHLAVRHDQLVLKRNGDMVASIPCEDLGVVVVDHPRHPFHGLVGKVIGRRGNRTPDDLWMLIFFSSKMRSYLIPESILRVEKTETDATGPVH